MPRWTPLLVGVTALWAASTAQAGSFDLNLGNNAIELNLAAPVANGIAIGAGVLHSEYREDATMLHGQIMGVERNRRMDIGVGARWTQFNTDYGNGGGLGLGGYGYVYLPNAPAVSVGGYGFFTPSVATSGKLDDSFLAGARMRYDFTPTVDGYVGYRRMTADFDDQRSSRTLDNSVHVGVNLRF
ncbi:YfaZ family outer membrane protein [Halomonas sp. M1]|uniref:YfaZ family outer membrane protein n=1 Tax=Halomonas sp. M1 TaxID=3035470 RepID=UPI002485E853|nr:MULTISPECIES: YfaZ family outer membrane protein [unclassified Halomonas]MDP3535853.1 YfaZ family outer membrane protein [Halomonas sp.]WFE70330.1 YfaZ family outer membrane protein [Halomonas sp. M1]